MAIPISGETARKLRTGFIVIIILLIVAVIGIRITRGTKKFNLSGCQPNKDFAVPGEEVVWSAIYSGGTGPYSFEWSGDGGIKGQSETLSHFYQNKGLYNMMVAVTDSKGKTGKAVCKVGISDLKVFGCNGSPDRAAVREKVSWNISFEKGLAPYVFLWEGDDKLATDTMQIDKPYLAGGVKKAKSCVTDSTGKKECADCEVLVKDSTLVFISSGSYNANFGGIAGADAECSKLAKNAGLADSDRFLAWISDSSVSVADRFFKSLIPYKLVNGVTVANSWNNLIDRSIDTVINVDESGKFPGNAQVWTGTDASGKGRTFSDYNCANWTTGECPAGDSSYSAKAGINSSKDNSWTEKQGTLGCCSLAKLYCFEQLREPDVIKKPGEADGDLEPKRILTAGWATFADSKLGLNFAYPKEWGALTVSESNSGMYTFSASTELIRNIYYHQPTDTLLYIAKGNGYKIIGSEDYAFDEVLKVLRPDRYELTVSSIVLAPEEDGTLKPFNVEKMESVNVSLDKKYVSLIYTGYEWSVPKIISLYSGQNILEGYNIWMDGLDLFSNVAWSPGDESMAIISRQNDFSAEGTNGVFVSDYKNPAILNPVFVLTQEQHSGGSYIWNMYFIGDDTLAFSVYSRVSGAEGKVTDYRYDLSTKELFELKY